MSGNQQSEQIGQALGRIASGAFIATATHEGSSTGMLASWVQQAGFEPPMLSMAVKKGRAIERTIDASGRFLLNIVPENDTAVFKHFAKSPEPGHDPFAGLEITQTESGLVLAECLGHVECQVVAKHETGDHNLYVAEVIGGSADVSAKPYIHLRKTGYSY